MRLVVKYKAIEINLEAQSIYEIESLGSIARDIIGGYATDENKTSPKQPERVSELNLARATAIEWVLATNETPMSAPEIAEEIKDQEIFRTKTGNPIHIVRRILTDDRFEKNLSGLFKLKEDVGSVETKQEHLQIEEWKALPPPKDDLEDPFADN